MSADPYSPVRAVSCELRAGEERLGSGVLIGPQLVLTCRHVVAEHQASELRVLFHAGSSGDKTLAVSRVERSAEGFDLALLELPAGAPSGWTPAPLGLASFGYDFLCWGFPVIRRKGGSYPEYASSGLSRRGIILAPVGTEREPRLQLQSKLEIHPGLSGSPIVQVEPFRLVALMANTIAPHNEAMAVPVSILSDHFPGLVPTGLLEPHPPRSGVGTRRIVAFGKTRTPSRNFVGRKEDLLALEEGLTTSGKVAVQAAITGLPGIGKTELALHYAHYHADEILFPGGVIWLDASTDLTGQWALLGPILGLEMAGLDPTQIEPAVLNELAGRDRILLVLDNAERWQALQGHLPVGGTGHAYLVTTRERGFAGAQFEHLPLGILDDENARALLRKVMGPRAQEHPEDVEALAGALAGHALALEVAGAYLRRHPGVPSEELVRNLPSATGKRVLDEVGYGRDFSAMMAELLARLAEDEPVAARLFPLLGLFGAAAAPLALLRAVWAANEKGDFDAAFETLEALHLVDRVGESGWAAHRLIGGQARSRLKANPETEVAYRRAQATNLLNLLLELGDYDIVGYSALKPHVQAASEWDCEEAEVGNLLQKAQQFPWRLGDAPLAKKWAERALLVHLRTNGDDATAVAVDRSNLATILRDLGDLEGARREAREALRIGRKALGDDHPNVAILRSNLATILRALGDLEGARREVEEALRIHRKALGDDHPGVAIDRSNLAAILKDLGDLEGARREVEEALRIHRKALGDDHPQVAILRSNLATILQDLGDLEGARREVEEALRIGRKALGDDHPNVAIRRSNLATILQALEDLEGARREAREAVRVALLQPPGSTVREQILANWRAWLEALPNADDDIPPLQG